MTSVASADVQKLAEALRASAHGSGTTTFQVLQQASGFILSEMEARAPVKTGKLRDSLGVKVGGDRIIIGPDVPYAPFVTTGTKPHEIKPRKPGGVLVFQVGDRKVFAKKVNHPGTAPNPYIQESFNAWVDKLGDMAVEANIQKIKEEMD